MIIEKSMIFNETTLNVFTDASVLNIDGKTYSSPGYCIYLGDTRICKDCIILENSTNNEGEVYAVFMAINKIIELVKEYKILSVNIYSDSKITVFGLREWLFNWVNHISNGYLCNADGYVVANQSIFLRCVYLILDNNLKVNILHVRGHSKPEDLKNVNNFKNTFEQLNNIPNNISVGFAMSLINYNNYIDKYTRDCLTYYSTHRYSDYYVFDYKQGSTVFQMYDKSRDIYKYKNLLNKDSKYFIY